METWNKGVGGMLGTGGTRVSGRRLDHFSSFLLCDSETRSPPIDWATRQNAAQLNSTQSRFSNYGQCKPEVAGDVTSGVAVDYVSLEICVKFGNPMLNTGRMIRLFVDRTRFTLFCAVFSGILQPTRGS